MKKIIVTAFLFLIGTLHTMIFSFIQLPGTFISADLAEDPIFAKAILYFFTVSVSCFHQPLARHLGLKKVLIFGLLGNILGLFLLFFHHFVEHPHYHFLLYLSMMCFGASMLSVVNSLVTYIILEYPAKTVAAITALFAFLNAGIMTAPLFLGFFASLGLEWGGFFPAATLLILATISVKLFFFEPVYPAHLQHLRSGTLLWREMHKRLSLYVLAIFLYSLTESTFSLWGTVHLLGHGTLAAAENASSIFWLFMIIGQLVLMIPLYYFAPRKLFYYLVPVILFALIFTADQVTIPRISLGLAIGGFSCAIIYPIVLALLEMEIIHTAMASHHADYLPLIDTAVSFLMAAYLLGSSVIDFWIHFSENRPVEPYFYLAAVFVAAITFLMLYLDMTRRYTGGIKGTLLRKE